MCRNIKMLFNFEPVVTPEEIRAASIQYVRKISGFNKPSKANEAAFLAAVDEVAAVSARLLSSLETNAQPRNPGWANICAWVSKTARIRRRGSRCRSTAAFSLSVVPL